jgi:hypothetical protein
MNIAVQLLQINTVREKKDFIYCWKFDRIISLCEVSKFLVKVSHALQYRSSKILKVFSWILRHVCEIIFRNPQFWHGFSLNYGLLWTSKITSLSFVTSIFKTTEDEFSSNASLRHIPGIIIGSHFPRPITLAWTALWCVVVSCIMPDLC